MKVIITGRSLDVTEGLRQATEDKLAKLDKYFSPDTQVYVTLSVDKSGQKTEVTIPLKGHIVRAEQISDDMYVTIDLVVDVLEAQLKKYRKKIVDRQQNQESLRREYLEEPEEDEVAGIKIVKTKRFGMKPMFPEDACVQMELLGHNFYVFQNAETDEVNVVYKRNDSTYGLIEPEF